MNEQIHALNCINGLKSKISFYSRHRESVFGEDRHVIDETLKILRDQVRQEQDIYIEAMFNSEDTIFHVPDGYVFKEIKGVTALHKYLLTELQWKVESDGSISLMYLD